MFQCEPGLGERILFLFDKTGQSLASPWHNAHEVGQNEALTRSSVSNTDSWRNRSNILPSSNGGYISIQNQRFLNKTKNYIISQMKSGSAAIISRGRKLLKAIEKAS
jgi:hypothetical protein